MLSTTIVGASPQHWLAFFCTGGSFFACNASWFQLNPPYSAATGLAVGSSVVTVKKLMKFHGEWRSSSSRRLGNTLTLARQRAYSRTWRCRTVWSGSGCYVDLQMSSHSRQMEEVVLRHRVLMQDSLQKRGAIRLK